MVCVFQAVQGVLASLLSEHIAHKSLILTLLPFHSKRVPEPGEMINAQRLKSVVGFLEFQFLRNTGWLP